MVDEKNIEQKARLEAMEYFECTEQEFIDSQKAIEDSLYYRKRVLYHSIIELGQAFKRTFKNEGESNG